jgi:hypothetical protein
MALGGTSIRALGQLFALDVLATPRPTRSPTAGQVFFPDQARKIG